VSVNLICAGAIIEAGSLKMFGGVVTESVKAKN
jgi:hypothetical protein